MDAVHPPTAAALSDLIRLIREAAIRYALPPEEPEVLRAAASLGWRAGALLRPGRRAVLIAEIRAAFGANRRTAEAIAREAEDSGTQARLEQILAPRITDFRPWITVSGDLPPGALLLHPTVAAAPLLRAALARRYPGIVLFGARGLPEDGGVGPLRSGRINRYAAASRRREEDRLPAVWEEDAGALAGHLARGARVVAAFDDRAFGRFERAAFLGREAWLSPEPWGLLPPGAEAPGAERLWFAEIRRERDRVAAARLTPAPAEAQAGEAGMAAGLAWFGRWLQRHPGQYALWLAECRIREGMDAHPLFPDPAPATPSAPAAPPPPSRPR